MSLAFAILPSNHNLRPPCGGRGAASAAAPALFKFAVRIASAAAVGTPGPHSSAGDDMMPGGNATSSESDDWRWARTGRAARAGGPARIRHLGAGARPFQLQ